MSTLLEQAIIDAQALREAAVKSAEQSIIEKYAPEIKKAVQALVEQQMPPEDPMMMGGPPPPMDPAMGGMPMDPAMGGMPMDPAMGGMPPEGPPPPDPAALAGVPVAPMAATDGEPLCPCPDEGQQITIDFNELAGKISAEEQALEAQQAQAAGMGMPPGPPMGGPPGMMPPAPPALPPGPSPLAPGAVPVPMPMGESIDSKTLTLNKKHLQELVDSELESTDDSLVSDDLVERIAEEIRASFSAPDMGLGGRTTPAAVVQEADEIAQAEVAVAQAREKAEEEELKEHFQRLQTEINYHKNQSNEYKKVLNKMKEHVHRVNLSNAKLLYTNRVLSDPSLNERQQNKIVDAITQCGSVEEAKVIYETLQNAVGSSVDKISKAPKSLREAVSRDRSLLLPRRKRENKSKDMQTYQRMKALAGLK
jgi:hypothetical protein